MEVVKKRNPSTKVHEEVSIYSYEDYCEGIETLAKKINSQKRPTHLCGIHRGGLVPAVHLSCKLAVPLLSLDWRSPESCDALRDIFANDKNGIIMVDEIIDSGGTKEKIEKIFNRPFQWACLVFNKALSTPGPWRSCPLHHIEIDRRVDNKYVIFHWDND